MWNGKKKAITFSFDDAVLQDIRFIEILDKYGLKATFNLNSQLLGTSNELFINGKIIRHDKVKRKDVKGIYQNHEVAVHTLTHPLLPEIVSDEEIVRQVEQDRINLSEMVGYEVVGMAYPCGGENNDHRTAELIKMHTGVRYARAFDTTGNFQKFPDLYRYKGSVYCFGEWDKMHRMADEFLRMESEEPKLFYIWGHSYEFDVFPERWEQMENFCEMISNKGDIFYGTNREVLL